MKWVMIVSQAWYVTPFIVLMSGYIFCYVRDGYVETKHFKTPFKTR